MVFTNKKKIAPNLEALAGYIVINVKKHSNGHEEMFGRQKKIFTQYTHIIHLVLICFPKLENCEAKV